MDILYNVKFTLVDDNNEPIKLRRQLITSVFLKHRLVGNNETDWTMITDFNIDETANDGYGAIWFRVPQGDRQWFIAITVGPLRCVQTAVNRTNFQGVASITAYATNSAIESNQGFSPRLVNGEWWEYDDANDCFVNTHIKAESTIVEDFPIVDYAEEGLQSAITSNYVYTLEQNTNSAINAVQSDIDALEDKRVSVHVQINGEDRTATEDNQGLVDIGSIDIPNGIEGLHYVENHLSETDINGNLLPKGSVLKEDRSVFSLSSPHRFFTQTYPTQQWYYIGLPNGSVKINVQLSVYNSSYGGDIYVTRNGYSYGAVTTNPNLATLIKIYQKSYNGYLVVKGMQNISFNGIFEVLQGAFLPFGTPIDDYGFNEDNLVEMDVFMTSYTEKDDYIDIDTNSYSTTFEGLEVFKYNLLESGTTSFSFTDEVMTPTILYFVAVNNDTVIEVSDSTNSWTAVSDTLGQGEMAVLSYVDSQNYSWSYTTKKEYEVTSNKVGAITDNNKGSLFLYPSLKAITDYVDTAVSEGELPKELVYADFTDLYGEASLSDGYGNTIARRYGSIGTNVRVLGRLVCTEIEDSLGNSIPSLGSTFRLPNYVKGITFNGNAIVADISGNVEINYSLPNDVVTSNGYSLAQTQLGNDVLRLDSANKKLSAFSYTVIDFSGNNRKIFGIDIPQSQGSIVSYNSGTSVLTIDGTNNQLFQGLHFNDWGVYYFPSSDGIIELQVPRVKVNGQYYDFTSEVTANQRVADLGNLPRSVKVNGKSSTMNNVDFTADLGDVYWNLQFSASSSDWREISIKPQSLIEVVTEDDTTFKIVTSPVISVSGENYTVCKVLHSNGRMNVFHSPQNAIVYFQASKFNAKVFKGSFEILEDDGYHSISATTYEEGVHLQSVNAPSSSTTVSIGNKWSSNSQYSFLWNSVGTNPDWQLLANNSIVYINYWLDNQVLQLVPPSSPFIDGFEKTIKIDNNTSADKTITFSTPSGSYGDYSITYAKDFNLGSFTIPSGSVRIFRFRWNFENASNCFWSPC